MNIHHPETESPKFLGEVSSTAPTSTTMTSLIPVDRSGPMGVLSIYPPSTSTACQLQTVEGDVLLPLSERGGRRPAKVMDARTYRLIISRRKKKCESRTKRIPTDGPPFENG
jgi:hypothetical protein